MKNPIIKTTTVVSYRVTHEGLNGHFAPDGYSRYDRRLSLYHANALSPDEQVYGYKEALAHIKELRESEYNGEKHNQFKQFFIEIVTTSTTSIPVLE